MRTKFYAIVLLQIAVVIAIASANAITLAMGRTILLRTMPIDPRSMFQGQYVDLSYEISALNTNNLLFDRAILSAHRGQNVYTVLRKQGKYWEPTALRLNPPPYSPDRVILAGTIDEMYGSTVRVRYGIETFFVPEELGPKLENASGKFDVEVSVSKSGKGMIKRVLYKGKPISFKSDRDFE